MGQAFNAIIMQHEGNNGAYVEIPFDIQAKYGVKRLKVVATFDACPYRGSVVHMGGHYLIGITQDIRRQLQKTFGDQVAVTLERDDAERIADLPPDFLAALNANTLAKAHYDSLAYIHQKNYVNWIADAKQPQTRCRRMEKALERLTESLKLR